MKLRTVPIVFLLSVSFSFQGHATEASHKKECQSIQKQIERINQKRRAGGSNRQMEHWKRQRRVLSDRAYKLRCHKLRIAY